MNQTQAIQLVRDTFESVFAKAGFIKFIKNLLTKYEEAEITRTGNFIPDAFKEYVSKYERVGKYTDSDDKRIDILVVWLKRETAIERARSMQRNFVAGYLQGKYGSSADKDAALVAFVSPDETDWRFSLVKLDYVLEEKEGKVRAKEEFTPSRRWSFLVGVHEKSHTAQSRLVPLMADDEHQPTLVELEEAFNIETVTKEFFEKYRGLFIWTKEELDKALKADSAIRADFEKKGVNTVDLAKKLLGQIIFLYYLQKKGWFGVPRDGEWGAGSKVFLRELFEKKHGGYKNFFNDILEPLFYEALRIDRSHDDHYYSRFDCKIPFLNGGLFDPMGNYDWVKTNILLPDKLFSNTAKTEEGDTGNGILDVFDRYNFTVREDEPFEKEVAIDPELLGKAYEKFNAIRPDNFDEFLRALKSGKKGDESKFNKQYGVYYTPREIVHYMCQQSLINYLATELEGKASKDEIALLIQSGETLHEHEVQAAIKATKTYSPKLSETIRANATLLDQKLAAIRVCDPAVGSGAFPVGMMSEIVRARSVLKTWTKTRKTLYDFKRKCIENSLFGVDIDPGAVEIAKLRLWLSLIVDEDDIQNIKPLPNLDYKIVCGNSLIGFPEGGWESGWGSGGQEIEALIHQHFNETNVVKKNELKTRIDEKFESRYKNSLKAFGYEVNFDFKAVFLEVFQNKGGFDVVIGNPPYGVSFSREDKDLFKTLFADVHIRTPDSFNYFISKSLRILRQRAVLSFIVPSVLFFQNEYEKTRRLMLNKSLITAINFGDGIFDSATVSSCVFVLANELRTKYLFAYCDLRDHAGEIANWQKWLTNCDSSKSLDTPGAVFGVLSNEHELIKKVASNSYLIDEIAYEVAAGISTGGDKVFRVTEELAKELDFEKPLLQRVLVGGEIDKWNIHDSGHLLIYTQKRVKIEEHQNIYTYLKPFKHQLSQKRETRNGVLPWWCLHWSRYPELFSGRKIIMRQTADSIRAVIDDNNYFVLNSILVLKFNPDAPISYEAALAILNSKLNNFIYRKLTQEEGRTFAEVKPKNVRKLYIPKINDDNEKVLEKLVDRILAAKRAKPEADTSKWEWEIDKMVYKLYGLTSEEIAIVEEAMRAK